MCAPCLFLLVAWLMLSVVRALVCECELFRMHVPVCVYSLLCCVRMLVHALAVLYIRITCMCVYPALLNN